MMELSSLPGPFTTVDIYVFIQSLVMEGVGQSLHTNLKSSSKCWSHGKSDETLTYLYPHFVSAFMFVHGNFSRAQ